MANLKTLGTFAIIIGCFAVIYPRFLHPMFLRLVGMQPKMPKEEDSMYPPHMRHGPVPGDRRPPPLPTDPKDMRHHMRPGPHPGMRAAAEMQKQQSQGSGRGMMGIVLPMYAIGICVYLVYTLFKVFNKKGGQSDPYKPRYESEHGRLDRLGFPAGLRGGQGTDQDEVQRFLTQKQQQRDLEDLLVKMDDTKNVPEDEMRALQKRLEETEAQMTRILQAMQAMQAQASAVAASEGADLNAGGGDKVAQGSVETVGSSSDDNKESVTTSQDNPSATSSPDTESYEIVKNSIMDATDASPNSEASSSSPFQQVDDNLSAGEDRPESAREVVEEGEDILMESKEDEEECSSVRHRKSAHADES